MEVRIVRIILFVAALFMGVATHLFGMQIPHDLEDNPREAWELIQHSLDALTGKQICHCLTALEYPGWNSQHAHALALLDHNPAASARVDAYYEGDEEEELDESDDEGDLFQINYTALQTIDGLAQEMQRVQCLKQTDVGHYTALLSYLRYNESLSSALKIIQVWDSVESLYVLSGQDQQLQQEALRNTLSHRTMFLVQEALDILNYLKSQQNVDDLYHFLRHIDKDYEASKVTFIFAFLQAHRTEQCFLSAWPVIDLVIKGNSLEKAKRSRYLIYDGKKTLSERTVLTRGFYSLWDIKNVTLI